MTPVVSRCIADGENWFTVRTSSLGPIPLTHDLKVASKVLDALSAVEEVVTENSRLINASALIDDLWTMFVRDTQFRESRVLQGSFQHDNPRERHNLQTLYHNDVKAARQAQSQRPISWLRQYGTCGDHLTAHPSTLRQAGLGAFASRTLPASTIVAQLPMIHIPHRDRLEMFPLLLNELDEWVPAVGSNATVQQLLLNYCFGHAESTMLLCPYGPMVGYVNHNQSLANVRLRWGSPRKGNHVLQLLNETVAHIESSYGSAKLAMELVATREIQAGEEVFMDYGDEWEAAWQSHMASWKPVPGAAEYTSALQLNTDTSRLRTLDENTEESQYPENVQLLCDVSCHIDAEEVQRHFSTATLAAYLREKNQEWWPCTVLDYELDEAVGQYLYTIEMQEVEEPFEDFLVHDVPREIFHFVDKPYTTDTHLPNVFRHNMRIPDEIFPDAWRNIPYFDESI
jgi:SET domain